MPSFEETNQADQDNPDFQYEPGTQNDLEKSDVVVDNSVEETPVKAKTVSARKKDRTEVPAELKPDVLDASIPLPKPAPLQRTKVEKFQDPDAAKKPNLRSRWKSDASTASRKQAHSFGQVDNLSGVTENLSGRQSKSPERPNHSPSPENHREKTDHASASTEDREDRPKRSRNQNRNRRKRNDSPDEHRDRNTGKENAFAEKTARKQAKKRTSRANPSASKSTVKQPDTLVGKIVKSIKSLFGGVEHTEPESDKPRRQGPNKKQTRNHNRRRQGGRSSQPENQEGRPPAKKRTRRRKRPNNRKPRNHEDGSRATKSGADSHESRTD